MDIEIKEQLDKIGFTRPVIFYGAGQCAVAIAKDLERYGIHPVCFADKDRKKQGKKLLGFDILSPSEAFQRYPNSLIYITTYDVLWDSIENELVQEQCVLAGNIINRKFGKKHRSCFSWEHAITTNNRFISPCCVPLVSRPSLSINFDDYDETVLRYKSFRKESISKINSVSPPGWCKDCPLLIERHWIGNGRIHVINISDSGVCQFNCFYCTNENKNNKPSELLLPDYSKLINSLARHKMIESDLLIKIGPDEITAHPQCNSILDACSDYSCEIFTNAAIYNDRILKMLDMGQSSLLVSMDCGTRESFAKIKGRDLYYTVCDNLKKYASHGGKIKLKYIFLPGINDNFADVNGFIELCEHINAAGVIISKNKNDAVTNKALPNTAIEMAKYLLNKSEEKGFAVTYTDVFFSRDELSKIKEKVVQ